ncbi:aquaporin [Candidatus Mycalebacterium sp.]
MHSLTKKLTVEFIGAFFLVFTIGISSGDFAPFAVAGVLMAMIFAGGHISGAHYNPAVTVSMFLRGSASAREVVPYVLAQIAAAGCAGLLSSIFAPAQNPPVFDTQSLLIAETVFTFALCFVILNVATASGTAGNSFYGLAIGFVILSGAIAVGPVSGAVFNPAVAAGLFVRGAADFHMLGLYTVASLAGGVAAAFVFLFTNGKK